MDKTKTEVLIVGAGPTGLSLAAQLIRYGVDFIIIDKKAGPTQQSKALVIHARSLEIFDQIGLAQKAVTQGKLIQKITWLDRGRPNAVINFACLGEGLSPFPYVLIHEQSKTEQLLYDYLREQGKDVQWATALDAFTQDEQRVKATLSTTTGGTLTVEARYVVGADGSTSPVRHQLGLDFGGSTNSRLFYVADVAMEYQADGASLYVVFRDYSFMLMLPMPDRKAWRLVGNLPEYDAHQDPEITFTAVADKVKKLIQQPVTITKVNWFSTYRIHTRHAEQFSAGRCFLVGDAAHVHTPAGGQGMNTGIQDAYNLAWKLGLVLRERAGINLLATYTEERLANARHLLKTTDRLFDMATGGQWWLRLFRDIILGYCPLPPVWTALGPEYSHRYQ